MLASDDKNPDFVGAHDPDSRLHVQFYVRPVENIYRSGAEGRKIFEDITFVKIHLPGDQLNVIDTPARDEHKARFPRHWEHFERTQGKENLNVGTPLEQWPMLSRSQVEELRALKFFTVDMVAFSSDEQINRIGMAGGMSPYAFRDKAKRFLEVAKDASAADRAAQQLEAVKAEAAKQAQEHAAQMQAMQEQMSAMQKQMADIVPRGKPGPKPKQAETV